MTDRSPGSALVETDGTLQIWASGKFCDDLSARLAAEVLRLRALAALSGAEIARLQDLMRQQTDLNTKAINDAIAAEAECARLRQYASHKADCAMAYTYQQINAIHVEDHIDHADGPLAECSSNVCQAWAAATIDTPVTCTCGLIPVSPPQQETK